MVTIPAETGDTSRFVEKLIVPAVPTVLPSCFITTPEPDATMPVKPDPSPINVVAVTTPVIFAPPVPVINY